MSKFNDDIIPRLKLEEKITAINILGDIPKPALIVEGKTDVSIYSKVLTLSMLDMKKFEIIIGECKSSILKFHDDKKIPFKYVAILDSDFERYKDICRVENNLIYTHFYDMENYLTTIDVIEATFNDFKDIYTNDIGKEELYDRMIECLYAYIVAIKYKLNCLEKVEKGENMPIFSLEDESIFNEKWWSKKENKVDYEKIKSYLVNFYKKNKIDFDSNVWHNIDEEYKNGKSSEEHEIDFVIKGRRLIEAYLCVFQEILGNTMKKRDRDVFMNDLRKNLDKSVYVQELVKEIDMKLKVVI